MLTHFNPNSPQEVASAVYEIAKLDTYHPIKKELIALCKAEVIDVMKDLYDECDAIPHIVFLLEKAFIMEVYDVVWRYMWVHNNKHTSSSWSVTMTAYKLIMIDYVRMIVHGVDGNKSQVFRKACMRFSYDIHEYEKCRSMKVSAKDLDKWLIQAIENSSGLLQSLLHQAITKHQENAHLS